MDFNNYYSKYLLYGLTIWSELLILRREKFKSLYKKAHDMILHSQIMMIKETTFKAYQKGNQVWLGTKNLKITHPTHKL